MSLSPSRASMSTPGLKVQSKGESVRSCAGFRHSVGRFARRQWAFTLCICLHLVMVAAHAILIIIRFEHHQHIARDTLALEVISLIIIITPTAIVKLYLVLVLLVTQGLALKRNLYYVNQPLSSLHEKSSSWLGVRSAAIAMWRQLVHRPHSARAGVFLILAYLSGIFVLGITTPALINVGFADINDPILANTTTYLAKVQLDDISRAFPIVSVLPLLGFEIETLGYQDSSV